MSPHRQVPQPSRKTAAGWAYVYWKKRVRNPSTRVSPVYSACERSAASIGMCGHRSAWPASDVRSALGPKKPSAAWVASTPSIQRRAVARRVGSPVT
ncbi:hypothetical protein Phou_072460 [Phytohabitans houttuyneae]|uniref:Uncharacterized protein n=1 Tax=Phytohabitans houttuyneae TaxID=1076126 RepID=A0A6V8KM88_9ACTN|nr:hypothetical protein Phou_072460 [Phytohabitans houttuyneae]